MRLLSNVSDVSEWLVKRPQALAKTIGMVQSMLEGAKSVVHFEEYCKETYKDEGWEDVLPDFIVMLKKLQISVKKGPKRKTLLRALERAEKKENEESEAGIIRVEVSKTMDGDMTDTTTLKFRKIEKEGNKTNKVARKKTDLVRYVNRMAEKKRKRNNKDKKDDNEGEKKKTKIESEEAQVEKKDTETS